MKPPTTVEGKSSWNLVSDGRLFWAFPEIIVTLLLRISMENSRGVKSLEFKGGTPKFEEKRWIFREVNAIKWKIPGGHVKFDWKSKRVNFNKINILNRGGTIFFLEKPIKQQGG